jgi:hypothetical protein
MRVAVSALPPPAALSEKGVFPIMFAMKTIEEQVLDLSCENVKLKSALDKTEADVEYIAMMTDVELDSDETEEDENNEQ